MIVFIFIAIFFSVIFFVCFNLPTLKGKIGETSVSNKLSKLDKTQYTIMNNLQIQLSNGSTTQVDHVIVSKYGIFVLETKNYRGWIFGKEQTFNNNICF